MPGTNGQTVIDKIKYMRQVMIQRIMEIRAKLGLSGQPLFLGMFFMGGVQKSPGSTSVANSSLIRAPAAAAGSAGSSYKNTEEWEIWEEKGKLKVRVHRDAKRG